MWCRREDGGHNGRKMIALCPKSIIKMPNWLVFVAAEGIIGVNLFDYAPLSEESGA